jgi:sporulation protein YlmC with PRC-barrel domain
MLQKISDLNGYKILATDGGLGTVSDFLFDDASWLVRWLVVDTGSWLSGRKVLLPPSALGHIDTDARSFSVRLTRAQVKDSPDVAQDQPVSRQLEGNVYDYYGWSPYWSTGLYLGGYGTMGGMVGNGAYGRPRRHDEEHYDTLRTEGDAHLRSAEAVHGYHIHATDGEIGHVNDFLLEDADWSIHYLVVDTTNWWAGKKVVISPRSAHDIDWSSRLINLNVDRETVRGSPLYDAAVTVDRDYERAFHRYYDDKQPRGAQ